MSQTEEVLVEEKAPKNPGAGLMAKFKKRKPKDDSDETKEAEGEAKKTGFHFNPRSFMLHGALVLGISAVLSVAAVFVLDLTGWRTYVRDSVVDLLIGKEKQAIEARMSEEFDEKLEQALSLALSEERAALEVEKQALSDREAEVNDLEDEARKRELEASQALEDAQDQSRQAQALISQAEGETMQISQLCDLYEAMEPENAAAIIEQIDDDKLVLQIFSQMKKETAAAIFEVMETEKAADILSRIGS